MRKPLEKSMKVVDLLVTMAEGNPGAATVLAQMMNFDPQNPTACLLNVLSLDDMNMRGSQIWVAYKYYCDHNLDRFIACVNTRDQGMVDKVNAMTHATGAADEPAVTRGASFSRREDKTLNYVRLPVPKE